MLKMPVIPCLDGNDRLAGATVAIDIHDATAFTLFGNVVTGEHVGASALPIVPSVPAPRRIGLPLV